MFTFCMLSKNICSSQLTIIAKTLVQYQVKVNMYLISQIPEIEIWKFTNSKKSGIYIWIVTDLTNQVPADDMSKPFPLYCILCSIEKQVGDMQVVSNNTNQNPEVDIYFKAIFYSIVFYALLDSW